MKRNEQPDLDILDGNVLQDLRQRLGADQPEDDSFDEEIKQMTPDQMLEAWFGWHLGSEDWAGDVLQVIHDIHAAFYAHKAPDEWPFNSGMIW